MVRGVGFVCGVVVGIAAMTLAGAAPVPYSSGDVGPIRPVAVVVHRFDMALGRERTFREWIDFLHARHRDAVATLARERTCYEVMFTAPDEPRRLSWLTVQGASGKGVESSDLDLDRRHIAYMDAALVKGSHRRLRTENVLAPDFIVQAVQDEQAREH